MKKWIAVLMMLVLLVPAMAMAENWNAVMNGLSAAGSYEGGSVKATLTKDADRATIEITGGGIVFDEMGMLESWPGAATTEYVFTDCTLDFNASYVTQVYTWGGSVVLRLEGSTDGLQMIVFMAEPGTENAVIDNASGVIGSITVHCYGESKMALEGFTAQETGVSMYANITAEELPDEAAIIEAIRGGYAGITVNGEPMNPADAWDTLAQITDGEMYYAYYLGTYDAKNDAWTIEKD